MALRFTIEDAVSAGPHIWKAHLTPGEIRGLGSPKVSVGARSIIGVSGPKFLENDHALVIDPGTVEVLNIGSTDEAVIVDVEYTNVVGAGKQELNQDTAVSPLSNTLTMSSGDRSFIGACKQHLNETLVNIAIRLLSDIRHNHPGELVEGRARKWVNRPVNFMALTIQNRNQSLAVHVKGDPNNYSAPSLNIVSDWGYAKFKLQSEAQLRDAIGVILASARSFAD